jgi:outer membrane usher protein
MMRPTTSPSRPRRRCCGLAAVAVVWAALAAAVSAGPTDEEQQRALLDLVVNEGARGQVLVLVRTSDVLVQVEALQRVGVGNFSGKRETIEDAAWVSLKSLAPGITYQFDERALALRVTVQPQHLVNVTRLDFRNADRPAYERRQSTSAFLNYGAEWRTHAGLAGTAETGLSMRGSLASATWTWTEGEVPIRGLSSVTFDRQRGLQRIVAGDSYVADANLGGSAFLGGVRVASEYSLDPYFVRYPTLGLSGMATTTSRVEVYVDNRLVRTETVEPGRFDLTNLTMPVGSSQTRLVIRDALGREQEITRPYYLSRSVLAKGLHEYEYAAGAIRHDVGTASWDYGAAAFFARHRYGFTDSFTAGLRAEGTRGVFSAGPTVNLRLPVGEVELSGAASRSGGRTGSAGQAGYLYSSRPFSTGFTWRGYSREYRTLAPWRGDEGLRSETSVFAGMEVGRRATVTVQYGRSENQAGLSQRRAFVYGSARLARGANLYFSGGRSTGTDGRDFREFAIGLNLALGARVSAVAGFAGNSQGSGPTVELQQSVPIGTGYGYRVAATGGPSDGATGRLEYQSSFGRYQFQHDAVAGADTSAFSVAGGLVALGGRAYATRPVDQSFALLRVPGVPGVRGYLSNQEVGRTDKHGDLLIPNLLPYYANRLRVEDKDIPIDRTVETIERQIAPPFRGGALVVFDAAQIRSIAGRVEMERDGRVVIPEYGELFVESAGRRVESPIGRDGGYYLEGLRQGRHEVHVSYLGASCSFIVVVPSAAEAVVDVGLGRCVVK